MSGDELRDQAGDELTITLRQLDGSRTVTVSGPVLTISEALNLFEDALRGAGFHVPHESLQMVEPS